MVGWLAYMGTGCYGWEKDIWHVVAYTVGYERCSRGYV